MNNTLRNILAVIAGIIVGMIVNVALVNVGPSIIPLPDGADVSSMDRETFTQATLEAGPSAVFFGFTHCPDVCPTTLGDILTWQEEFPAAADMGIYFVTVDPARDTTEILGEYVGWVDGVQGVTGSQEEVDKALEAFRIYAAKVPLDDGDYTMDHSASVLLFDGEGRYTDRISYQEALPSAIEKLKTALGS